MKQKVHIRCPLCAWEPQAETKWLCSVCNTKWNTFDTCGQCPACNKVYEETACPKNRGGCGMMSPHSDWYESEHVKSNSTKFKSLFPWKKEIKPPITDIDKKWIEASLLTLTEMFEPDYFKSLITITPDKKYFDRQFSGTEEDVIFVFESLISLMHINAWEIELMFYSNPPTKFSEGIVATPQEKLKGSWKSSSGEYVNKGLGHKEIWIGMDLLNDPQALIATLAHELAHYKLLGEYRMEYNDEHFTDLTAIAFGFGIFMGNSHFKFEQWHGNTHHGWQMQKKGYLPEQVIAYAMAWLAYYRNEDISWKYYLNKTILKYFDKSYQFISQNKDLIKGIPI